MSRLLQSYLNPVKFHPMNPVQIEQYVSRHMDHYPYIDTIQPWETTREYFQPWMQSDIIRLQMFSDYGPLRLQLIDVDERVWWDDNMDPIVPNYDDPALNIYEIQVALGAIPEGVYFLKLSCGAPVHLELISEPLKVLQLHKHSLLLLYKHSEYYQDTAFETGFFPSIRIRATLSLKSLSSKDSFFEDQVSNPKQTDAVPFETYELKVGGASGIPNWFAKKLNRIFGCSTLLFDGVQLTKFDGSKWEPATQANYPMRSWTIELRESVNSSSMKYEDDAVITSPVSIIAAVNSKGFGLDGTGGSDSQIQDVF